MEETVKMDMYREGKKYCTCSRQVTTHVAIMAFAGIVYLGIGILMGYYIGKQQEAKSNCKLHSTFKSKDT